MYMWFEYELRLKIETQSNDEETLAFNLFLQTQRFRLKIEIDL